MKQLLKPKQLGWFLWDSWGSPAGLSTPFALEQWFCVPCGRFSSLLTLYSLPFHFPSLLLDSSVNRQNSAALQNPTEQKNTDYFLLQERLLSATADLGAQDCTGPGEQEQKEKFLSLLIPVTSRSSFPSACGILEFRTRAGNCAGVTPQSQTHRRKGKI